MEQYGERYVEQYSALDILNMAYEELTQTQTESVVVLETESDEEGVVVLQEENSE